MVLLEFEIVIALSDCRKWEIYWCLYDNPVWIFWYNLTVHWVCKIKRGLDGLHDDKIIVYVE